VSPVPTSHSGSSCRQIVFSSCFLWKSWKDEIIRNVNDSYSYKNPHSHDKVLENDSKSYNNTPTDVFTYILSPILHAKQFKPPIEVYHHICYPTIQSYPTFLFFYFFYGLIFLLNFIILNTTRTTRWHGIEVRRLKIKIKRRKWMELIFFLAL
jgi:hypothetical protein